MNWKIEDDSNEARQIEERMKKEIAMWVKVFKHSKGSSLHKMINTKYIIKHLLPATEPLNQIEFEKKIKHIPTNCNIA